jgi:hypothetical protein
MWCRDRNPVGDGKKEEDGEEGHKVMMQQRKVVHGGCCNFKGDKSPSLQEFIDELDKNLQMSQLSVKKVKEGYIYKRKEGKKGEIKLKLMPNKEDKNKHDGKEDKKDKEDPKGNLRMVERRDEDQGTKEAATSPLPDRLF